MRKVLAAYLAALAFALSPLLFVNPSLLHAQQPGGAQVGPSASYNPTIANYLYGINVPVGALSVCTAGGGQAVSGNQTALLVTAGATAATSCTITWPVPRPKAPNCAITGHTVSSPLITVESTTVLTWTFASTGATVWDVVCLGDNV